MNIIPFGKHAGRTIDDLIADDPSWCLWIIGQGWFRHRFAPLADVVFDNAPDILERVRAADRGRAEATKPPEWHKADVARNGSGGSSASAAVGRDDYTRYRTMGLTY
jgi:hypothetical protein